MQSSNCYLFLKRPLSICNRPMANFVHSLNQSIGAMKPACHTQAPLKAVIWSQMFYNVSCVVVDGWFMLIPTKKHEMVHLRAVMHHMTKTQMSTFWECARLHVCALVCTFVRSLCATFCGDQNPQKPANCYKLHPKSLGTTCLQSSVHVGLILTFDLTFYPFGFTALVLQHHELIGQALVPKHLQWKCIAGLCRWIQRF